MLAQLRWNLVLLYAAEIVGKALGLVVFGYLARVLMAERYGDLEFSLGILFLLNLVIDAGLGHYGAREAAKHPGDTDRLVGQITLVRGALVLVSLVLLAVVAVVLPSGAGGSRDGLARGLIVLQGLVLLPTPFILTWVYQARDEMWVVATAAVVRQIVFAAGVLMLVRRPGDVWLAPLWDAVGLASAVGLQVVLFRRTGGSINPLRFLEGLRSVVVESAPLAGSSVVWAVRLFTPLLALGVFRTPAEVAVFAAGHRLVIALHTFVWLYFFNLLPSLSRLGTEASLTSFRNLFTTSLRLIAWVSICGASLGAILAPVLIPIVYGSDLMGAVAPFEVMVWMLTLAFISGHHRFSLIALSMQRQEFWASAVGASVAIVACAALGERLDPVSAAWIFVAAEGTTCLAAIGFLRHSVPSVPMLPGILVPLVFTLGGTLAVSRWSSGSAWIDAAALGVLYLAGVLALEKHGVRRLLEFRRAGRRP